MNSADLKALQRKVDRLGYDTGGGGKCGATLVANNSINKDALTTEEALALMRDGLRWRAMFQSVLLSPGVEDVVQEAARGVLEAL